MVKRPNKINLKSRFRMIKLSKTKRISSKCVIQQKTAKTKFKRLSIIEKKISNKRRAVVVSRWVRIIDLMRAQ